VPDNEISAPDQAPDQARTHLRNLWYFALPGQHLLPGQMMHRTLLGEPVLIGRGADGGVFALRDICPHRGMPLSYGAFDGDQVECCYHGWRFDREGCCTAIPSLVAGQKFDLSKVVVESYPAREVQGNIWLYFGDGPSAPRTVPEGLPAVPEIPDLAPATPRITETVVFPGHMDHAVVGLMDPAHGPFVHASWWWRGRESAYDKEKRFAPSELGFTMCRHRPSTNSALYRLLGGVPETEISFQLPGVRIEHVRAGRHVFCGLTAVTPIDDRSCLVNHVIYWTMPWLTVLRPALRPLARRFLDQDRAVVVKQQDGLAYNPPLMLVNDADVPAKWYYQLKNEFRRAALAGRRFENPLREKTLRWRS
jgi:phenylpropionate dioxygenase-like ring-hydroxylating dioxygenase large terminal subunit